MSITIREADLGDPRDAAAIVVLVDSYAGGQFGGGVPLPASVREGMVAGLRAHPTTLVLLACDAEEPIGIAVCFWGFSTFQARPLLNVHDLAVVPEAHGRGAGRALLAAAEARARERGCCKLTLEVLDDNPRARGLYASVGFADAAVGASAFTRFLSKHLDAALEATR
ncbi:MAG: GNAT family N-acetyltransferase [Candidatus Binatia bacterium]